MISQLKYNPEFHLQNDKQSHSFTLMILLLFLIQRKLNLFRVARYSCIRCQDPILNQDERFQCIECSEHYSFDYCKACNEASKHKHPRVKVYPSCTP